MKTNLPKSETIAQAGAKKDANENRLDDTVDLHLGKEVTGQTESRPKHCWSKKFTHNKCFLLSDWS